MARTSEERTELLKRVNEILERKERLAAEAKAEHKIIQDHLKSKYDLKTIAQAKKRLEKLKEEHETLVEEGEKEMDKLEESLEELDD
ncbi:unnamed protein product [marine sediment metagenome]|uniref:Uncharacterized protein n=1 Tax=marine sediment metagenome TaxID=412755 RepID=X0S780_9ZZZZ